MSDNTYFKHTKDYYKKLLDEYVEKYGVNGKLTLKDHTDGLETITECYYTDGIQPSIFNVSGIHFIDTPHHYDSKGSLIIDGPAYYHRKYGPAIIRPDMSSWLFKGKNVTKYVKDLCENHGYNMWNIPHEELDILYLVYGV